MRPFAILVAGASALGVAPHPALASSHREAPSIALDPAADNTDLWAWVDRGPEVATIVAAYNPMEEPSGGPNFHRFDDHVLYELHITRGAESLADAVTYQFRFSSNAFPRVDAGDLDAPLGGGKEFFYQLSGQSQTMTVTRIENGRAQVIAADVPVAPANVGPRTDAVLGRSYDDAFAATFIRATDEGGRVWAGPRDDGFYVDLGGVFDLANLRGPGVAQDGLAGFNCHAIAIEIPLASLTGTGANPDRTPGNDTLVGVWASASRRKVTVLRKDGGRDHLGPWVQVSRLGLPLVNEVLIGLQDKDKYNRTTPRTDVANFAPYFLTPVIVRDAEAVGVYGAGAQAPDDVRGGRADILQLVNLDDIPTPGAHSVAIAPGVTGDVLRMDLALDHTEAGFPNGRPIPGGASADQEQADVTDVLAGYILLKDPTVQLDNVVRNDKPYLDTFPYLALPWRGFDQGHGRAYD